MYAAGDRQAGKLGRREVRGAVRNGGEPMTKGTFRGLASADHDDFAPKIRRSGRTRSSKKAQEKKAFSQHNARTVAGILRDVAQAEILPRFRGEIVQDIREKTGPSTL
jgi:hypothetical protein